MDNITYRCKINNKTAKRLSRPCQQDAFRSITDLLFNIDACIVKMFCGTGKTRIMVELIITQEKTLNVIVFPNLALIRQFLEDYLTFENCPNELNKHKQINISSEQIADIESTTDAVKIQKFVNQNGKKIICVTYQSLAVLLDNLCGHTIEICLFDEAHRTTSIENKKLIYCEPCLSRYAKRIFFTATPVNKNGIIMYDRENNAEGKYGDCGPLAYEYTYLQGVHDAILKQFDIRIDMFTESSLAVSIYETIARAILTTGNTRVLTFHSEVSEESESDTSVLRFVDDGSFQIAFEKVLSEEFPDNIGKYKRITFKGLTGMSKDKAAILDEFDRTPDDEIFILSSCATIGEGVDTKKANMCVFVDPKTSYTAIIQNIGRIVRINAGSNINATVLIPVYVDRTKYDNCGDDKYRRDLVIREELVNGNYNGISNICAALKEEDPELYDIMVRYPSNFTPIERENAIKEQRCRVDYSEDKRKNEYEIDEMIEDGEPIEIHTSNVEEPIVRHNMEDVDKDTKVQRLFQAEIENDDGELETVYYPIVSENGKRIAKLDAPKKQGRPPRIDFHTNDEIKMLWSIKDGEDFGNNICSQVIECQVEHIRLDPMEIAIGIVERANKRFENDGYFIPKKRKGSTDQKLIQENKDAQKLGDWKKVLNGGARFGLCSYEVRDYLDKNLIGWRKGLDERAYEIAVQIVDRGLNRVNAGERLLPSSGNKNDKQQVADSSKLHYWRKKCPIDVRKYLDKNLPGWDIEYNVLSKALDDAKLIVMRAKTRESTGGRLMPIDRDITQDTDEILIQETKDARRIRAWKNAKLATTDLSKKRRGGLCPSEVDKYLSEKLPGWDIEQDFEKQSLTRAEQIIANAYNRQKNGGRLLPTALKITKKSTIEEKQESSDASKLTGYRQSLKGNRGGLCPVSVVELLDVNLPGWRNEPNDKMLKDAKDIVSRAKSRQIKGKHFMPKKYSTQNETTEELKQESKDNEKLTRWKNALQPPNALNPPDKKSRVINYKPPPPDVVDYLDKEIPEWRDENDDLDARQIKAASEIVERANQRIKKSPGANLIPRCKISQLDSEDLKQEQRDGQKLSDFCKALKGQRGCLCDEARKILDDGLPGWSIDNTDRLLEKWTSNFDKLLQHMDENKKRPSADNKSNTKEVIELGCWTQHQVNIWNEKSGWASNDKGIQYKKWQDMINDAKYMLHFASELEIWKINLIELLKFEKQNKRIPKQNRLKRIEDINKLLKNKELDYAERKKLDVELELVTNEKILCKWRQTTQSGYKHNKYIMKNTDIRKLWCKYMNGEEISNEEIMQSEEDKQEEEFIIDVKTKKKSMKLAKPTQNSPQETTEQKRARTKSELSTLHQTYKTLTSTNLGKRFKTDPQLWHQYHEISGQNEESFPEDEIPRNRIIAELNKIQTKRIKHVVDMGCGKAEISQHFKTDSRFKFTNYDHVAFDEDIVTSCDISMVPDEENTVDVVILSLAMWGSNCHDYITEAYRILESGGTLFIIEATKRWSDKDGMFNVVKGTEASKLRELLIEKGLRVIDERVEKFCMFKCVKP